jgi:hypothetical protein
MVPRGHVEDQWLKYWDDETRGSEVRPWMDQPVDAGISLSNELLSFPNLNNCSLKKAQNLV